MNMPVFISLSLLVICLVNIVSKKSSDLVWEKQTISVIFAYWVKPTPIDPKNKDDRRE